MTTYAGTWSLARAALRRDRVLASAWVLLLVVVVYASAAATEGLYPTAADRVEAAQAINNSPAIVALYGPILDVTSVGELAMTKLTVLYAVFAALLFLVLVRRHTRTEEESGRAELLGGTAIGRDAPLAAAVVEAALVALGLGILAAAASAGAGLPVAGSVAFGASWVGVSWVATGLTAVACQVSASARTCAAVAGAGLGFLYVLRIIGDTGPGWVSWLSPFGWSTRLRAWSDPRWWVLLLDLFLGALLVVVAQRLQQRRDLGAGLVAARPGPAEGSPRLADAFVLTWRTHRAMLLSWTVGAGALGLVMGAIAPSVGDLLDTEAGRQVIESIGGVGNMQDALVGAVLSIAGVIVTCFAVAVVTHGAGDERDGRTEQVLATGVSRTAPSSRRRRSPWAGRPGCCSSPASAPPWASGSRPAVAATRSPASWAPRSASRRRSGWSRRWPCSCTPPGAGTRSSAGSRWRGSSPSDSWASCSTSRVRSPGCRRTRTCPRCRSRRSRRLRR